MFFIDNEGVVDPYVNLALEEYCLRNLDLAEDYLLFYVNQPSIIIGKHQNHVEEINHAFVAKHDIPVVRRISGGGTVYHDPGCLNFSFITRYHPRHFNNYAAFTGRIVTALHSLGVDAMLGRRNEIVVGDKKVSGNAQFTSRDRMLSHGTLLFESNLSNLVNALGVKSGEVESRGVKSIRSRVANIGAFLTSPASLDGFRSALLQELYGKGKSIPFYRLSASDWEQINRLSQTKYRTWEWNYGLSPECIVHRTKRFSMGAIDVRIDIGEGRIMSLRFHGGFPGGNDISKLDEALTNIRFTASDVRSALDSLNLDLYMSGLSPAELCELFV